MDKMIVEKKALLKDNYYNKFVFFDSARKALEEILIKLQQEDVTLFLPAYIGWSSNEGSGIYDPVISAGIKHLFYPLDMDLNIDLDILKDALANTDGRKAVLLVDYFGFVDANYHQAIELIKNFDACIIEDAAHAFFTDFVDGQCGKDSDVVLYSLHKLFPCPKGGMIKINNPALNQFFSYGGKCYMNPFEYRLDRISEHRKEIAVRIEEELSYSDYFRFIRPMGQYMDCTPQTVPVIVCGHDKSDLYFKMNDMGYGVVSLYHTMIEPVRRKYPQAVETGNSILNLPVHQDMDISTVKGMCELLIKLCQDK